jgi:hypothetical protein
MRECPCELVDRLRTRQILKGKYLEGDHDVRRLIARQVREGENRETSARELCARCRWRERSEGDKYKRKKCAEKFENVRSLRR